jgi:hypothetical protein
MKLNQSLSQMNVDSDLDWQKTKDMSNGMMIKVISTMDRIEDNTGHQYFFKPMKLHFL